MHRFCFFVFLGVGGNKDINLQFCICASWRSINIIKRRQRAQQNRYCLTAAACSESDWRWSPSGCNPKVLSDSQVKRGGVACKRLCPTYVGGRKHRAGGWHIKHHLCPYLTAARLPSALPRRLACWDVPTLIHYGSRGWPSFSRGMRSYLARTATNIKSDGVQGWQF